MSEIKKLYWTGHKLLSPNFGIIALTNKGITIYKKKGIFGSDLRAEKYLELNFKDIAHITLNFVGFQKAISIYLTEEKYSEMLKKHNNILQSIAKFTNSEKKTILHCRSDSKSEVTAFIEKYNQLANSKKK